jgi:hypothetical protein
MKKNLFVVVILFSYITTSFAQTNLNAYKYIIVPMTYGFLKENDKYELNSLTKFLFERAGFETLMQGDDYPNDLLENPCLSLLVDVKDNSGAFTTKLTIDLTDCHNTVIFTAKEGKSKEKEYKRTYQEALRNSFKSIESLKYKYNPELAASIVVVAKTETVSPTAAETETVKKGEDVTKAPIKTEPEPKAIIAAPVVVSNTAKDTDNKQGEKTKSAARSYKNENISFFLIDQNNSLVAYVIESNIDSYKKGEMIGTFVKTSLPNVFKVSWKNKQEGIDQTIAYFDDSGNLKIEIDRNGEIEIIVFQAEK